MARVGTCKDCSTRYRIPDAVKATRAKCKKCGGVVEIPAAQPAPGPAEPKPPVQSAAEAGKAPTKRPPARRKTQAAPKAAPRGQVQATPKAPIRGKAKTAPVRRGTGAKREAGGKARGRSRPTRGRARGKEQTAAKDGKQSPVVMAGIGVAVLALVGGALWFFDVFGGDAPPAEPVQQPTVESVSAESTPSEENEADVAPAPEPAEDLPQAKAPAPVVIAKSSTDGDRKPVVDFFEPFPPLPGTTAEQLTEWSELVYDAFLDGPPPRARRKLMARLDEIEIVNMTPAFINAVHGLDLSDAITIRDTFTMLDYWMKRQGKFLHFFFDGDITRTSQEDINKRVIVLEGWVNWWASKHDDPLALDQYREDIAKKLAKQARADQD